MNPEVRTSRTKIRVRWLISVLFVLAIAPVSAVKADGLFHIGYFCAPDTRSIAEGQYYRPSPKEDVCDYLSPPELPTPRIGELYWGTVGNSTRLISHDLRSDDDSGQVADTVNIRLANVQQGDDMFVAIFSATPGPFHDSEAQKFEGYFATGSRLPQIKTMAF